MMLNTIDLQAMERVARSQANRRLSRYLCDVMAPVLPRLPCTPEYVPAFVETAGKEAFAAGYEKGRQYSTHITVSFLLGLGWDRDVHHAALEPVLTDPGMDFSTRMDMAMNTAIALRRQTENALPDMHLLFLDLLNTPYEKLQSKDIWAAFRHSALLRGLNDPKYIQKLYELYEADALHSLGIPPIERRHYSAYELAGIRYMGGKIPQPGDDLHFLEPYQLAQLSCYVLLALSLGRFFYLNPLYGALHNVLKEVAEPARYYPHLKSFLLQHRQTLLETTDVQ